MNLLSSLRGRPSPLLSSSDDKDHDSDANNEAAETSTATALSSSSSLLRTPPPPLLLDPSDGEISLRIKLNDGRSTVDFILDGVSPKTTVAKLKERILSRHFNSLDGGGSNTVGGVNSASNKHKRYLRLIVRGRMMAPDTSPLETFSIVHNDVIHAVLAKEGVRGGQQARMLRRLNYRNSSNSSNNANNEGGGNNASGGGTGMSPSNQQQRRTQQSLWRRIGIDSNGVVVPRGNNDDESDDDDIDSEEEEEDREDFDDPHGEIDLEMGQQVQQQRQQRRRRRHGERRGFDRLRSVR